MAKRHASGKRQTRGARATPPGRLRIVAGKWRSRVLDIADVEGLRPTAERVRETLFNWLAPRIEGSRCLDLFAGTGALGFEALSRGASSAVFVERSTVAAKTLRKNAALLNADEARVEQYDALDWLANAAGERFDIVFLDPPFADDRLAELCRLLEESKLLTANAVVYIEEDRARPDITLPHGWQISKKKSAGNVRFALLSPGTTSTEGES